MHARFLERNGKSLHGIKEESASCEASVDATDTAKGVARFIMV
jgi:hypothetical protein